MAEDPASFAIFAVTVVKMIVGLPFGGAKGRAEL